MCAYTCIFLLFLIWSVKEGTTILTPGKQQIGPTNLPSSPLQTGVNIYPTTLKMTTSWDGSVWLEMVKRAK